MDISSVLCRKNTDCTLVEIYIVLGLTGVSWLLIFIIQRCFREIFKNLLDTSKEQVIIVSLNIFSISNNERNVYERRSNNSIECNQHSKTEESCCGCCAECRECIRYCIGFIIDKVYRLMYGVFMIINIFDFWADLFLLFKFLFLLEWTASGILLIPGSLAWVLNALLITSFYKIATKDSRKESSEESQMESSLESRTESSEESRKKSCTCRPKDVNLLLIWILAVIPKAYLYGWLTVVGKQTWSKKWYLQALTFLHLTEICTEGFPQFLIEYNELDLELFLQSKCN